jgi:hypothetical protein
MWYNDDDIEKKQTNWKNSEVMRIFAEQYLNQEDDKPEEEEEVEEQDCGDAGLMDKPVKVIVVKEHLRLQLNEVIQKLASLSSQYGNEKVRYMMERAVDDLKAIQHYGE